jgi:queuine tRNA-ribosyltransferase
LFKAEEMLALRLAVMHNLFFYNSLMSCIRDALDNGVYQAFRSEYSEILDRRI